MTVTNSGDVPMLGWMVNWALPTGQSVAGLWNGSLSPGQSATFGYVVNGDGGDPATALPCQVG